MANDIKIKWDSILNEGDFNVLNGDIENESGLETAVILSLFIDARARDDDVLPDDFNDDKRGWWGDLASPDVEGDQIGSRRWIFIERGKTTQEIMLSIKQTDEESLQWLIDDEIAQKINIEVERAGNPGNDYLHEKIEIFKKDGQKETYEFDTSWEAQLNAI